ncbi:hypothetical protein [Rhodopila sp.]|uniref:hypothetical protein n=1 Tax=Rhodopila sp. TaxID=2480087 RepID=UPI002B9F9039|nr:hypothetical protein [Rhodopila sp.]HVZ09849.1 hypothetical protein [Rhodopila sp.]
MPMSLTAALPAALAAALPAPVVEMVVGLLVRMIMPILALDRAAARDAAIRMLADYQPRSGRELRLAGTAIGLSLNGLRALADAAHQQDDPAGSLKEVRRWVSGVVRAGLSAERQFCQARRATPEPAGDIAAASHPSAIAPGRDPEPARPMAAPPADTSPAVPDTAEAGGQSAHAAAGEGCDASAAHSAADPEAGQASPAATPGADAAEDRDDCPASALARAEAMAAAAEHLLTTMKARYKGAPSPHSPAAQQIRAQQRIVDTTRMKLAQLRRQARQNATSAAAESLPAVA